MAWGKGSWSLRKIFGGGAKAAPEETPEATPETSAEATPKVTRKATAKVAPKVTRKVTPKATPKATKSAVIEDVRIDENTWQTLEDALIGADFGLDLSEELVAKVRGEVERIGTTKADDVINILRDTVEEKLARYDSTLRLTERPAVVLVVGVNGVGKRSRTWCKLVPTSSCCRSSGRHLKFLLSSELSRVERRFACCSRRWAEFMP
jgi:signal recognition particle GTPase